MIRRILFLLFAAVIAVSCSHDNLPQAPEQDLEVQNVAFHLFTDKSFSEGRFDEAYVQVHLAVLTMDELWQTTPRFEKVYDWTHFRDFPKEANKIVEQASVTYDINSETVYVSYSLSFKVNGQQSAEAVSYSLFPGEEVHLVEVKL